MSGWLADDRATLATERILDAAGRLFAEHGPGAVGMDAVAREAGCSRATLYRYFDSRHAVLTAFAHREARRVVDSVASETRHLTDPRERAVESVIGCLREVRSHEHLRAWYGSGDSRLLAELLHESPLIEPFTARAVGAGDPADVDLARWVLRAILSLLAVPGDDEAEERRLITRFLAPHLGD